MSNPELDRLLDAQVQILDPAKRKDVLWKAQQRIHELSVPLGVYTATHQHSRLDHLITGAAFLAYAVPTFWLGLLWIMLFAVKFQQWGLPSFPAGGLYSLKKGPSLTGLLRHLVLPCFVLLIVSVASYIRHLCASTLKVLHQDYVRTARAKGVADTSVVWKHTFKNAPASRGWGPDSRDYIEKPLDLTGQRVEIVSGILHDECAALRAPAPN